MDTVRQWSITQRVLGDFRNGLPSTTVQDWTTTSAFGHWPANQAIRSEASHIKYTKWDHIGCRLPDRKRLVVPSHLSWANTVEGIQIEIPRKGFDNIRHQRNADKWTGRSANRTIWNTLVHPHSRDSTKERKEDTGPDATIRTNASRAARTAETARRKDGLLGKKRINSGQASQATKEQVVHTGKSKRLSGAHRSSATRKIDSGTFPRWNNSKI